MEILEKENTIALGSFSQHLFQAYMIKAKTFELNGNMEERLNREYFKIRIYRISLQSC